MLWDRHCSVCLSSSEEEVTFWSAAVLYYSDSELLTEFSEFFLYVLTFILDLLSVDPDRGIEHYTVGVAFGRSSSIATDSHLNTAEDSFIFKYPAADLLDARVESIGNVNEVKHVRIVEAS